MLARLGLLKALAQVAWWEAGAGGAGTAWGLSAAGEGLQARACNPASTRPRLAAFPPACLPAHLPGRTDGGAAFTVSSLLGCWEATGSWWRGLVPSRLSDLQSISWQVGCCVGGQLGADSWQPAVGTADRRRQWQLRRRQQQQRQQTHQLVSMPPQVAFWNLQGSMAS